ncbi:MAG: hypothetical protein P8O23_03225 [Opitutales bacterium]|nr:hypothetical protein [Opitutales bacterium]
MPFLAHTGGEFSVPVLNAKFADPRILQLPLECGVTLIAPHGAGKSGLWDPDYAADLLKMMDELASALASPNRWRTIPPCLIPRFRLTVAKEGKTLSVEKIANKHEISKATLYRWLERFRMNAVGALLYRTYRRYEYSASRACRKFEIRVIHSGRVRARLDVQRRREAGEDSPWMGMFEEF